MSKLILLIVVVIGIILIAMLGGRWIAGDAKKIIKDVNIEYEVRDVHTGYVNGASIIVVEYYNGNSIENG